MKRKYAKPIISIYVFKANEYIATCAVGLCNISVNKDDETNVMYTEKNNENGYQKGREDPYREADVRYDIGHKACSAGLTTRIEQLQSYMHDADGTGPYGDVQQIYYFKTKSNSHFSTWYQTTGASTC